MSQTFNVTTPNLGLNKPAVGGDDDLWGELLNANADVLDGLIPFYLPLAGGVLSGSLQLPNGTAAVPSLQLGANDGTGFSRTGSFVVLSLQGAMSWAFTNVASQTYLPLYMLNNRIQQLGDATAAADALNLRTADARYLPLAGGTLSGPLALPAGSAAAPSLSFGSLTSGCYGIGAGIGVASIGTQVFSFSLSQNTSLAPLMLAADPAAAMQATTKRWVEEQIAATSLFQGTWDPALNQPDLMNPAPLTGYAWIVSPAGTGGVVVTDTIPGLTGMLVFAGDHVIWDGNLGIWQRVRAGDLSYTEGIDLFLQLTGGALTGPLALAADPTTSMQAATKQYVDGFLPLTGGTLSGGLNFGSEYASAPANSSRHLALYPGYGINVTAGRMNYVADPAGAHVFALANSLIGQMHGGGLVMSLPVTLASDPTAAMHAATKQYVDAQIGGGGGDYLPLTGGAMAGEIDMGGHLIRNVNAPLSGLDLANKDYVDAHRDPGGPFLPLSGGTLTGPLTLAGDPTATMQAATKQYVDAHRDPGGPFATPAYVDSQDQAYAASAASVYATYNWVEAYFKPIGAYTPNQSVDAYSNPTFADPTATGTVLVGSQYGICYAGVTGEYIGFYTNGTAVILESNQRGELYWVGTVSDVRLKRNIAPAGDALASIARMQVHEFDRMELEQFDRIAEPDRDRMASVSETKGQHWQFGLIADELEEDDADCVIQPGPELYKSLDPLPLIARCIKAIQQLTTMAQQQAVQIAQLQRRFA